MNLWVLLLSTKEGENEIILVRKVGTEQKNRFL